MQRVAWRRCPSASSGSARAGAGTGAGAGADQSRLGCAIRALALLDDRAVILQRSRDDIPFAIVHQHDVARCHVQPAQIDDGACDIRKSACHLAGPQRPKALLSIGIESRHLVAGADRLDRFRRSIRHEYGGAGYEAAGRRRSSRVYYNPIEERIRTAFSQPRVIWLELIASFNDNSKVTACMKSIYHIENASSQI